MRWTRSLFSSRKTTLFGLDISSDAVRLVELTRIGDQFCVQTFGQAPLPEAIMLGNMVHDIPALGQVIRDLLVKVNLWSRHNEVLQAVIAVPDACTIHKNIQVGDRLNDCELEELVALELAKCIPDSLDDIYYDFKHLNSLQPGTKDLLIIAAQAQYVKDRVAALRHIGLPATVVDVESFAMQRVLPFLRSPPKTSGITVILNLGLRFLKVFFFKQECLLFMHEEEFGLLNRQSEELKLAYQDGMMQRFKRACHFLCAEYAQTEPLTQIIIAGEGAQLASVLAWMQQHCEPQVLRANPFIPMLVAEDGDRQQLDEDAPLYLTACGLAKRGC